MAAGAATGVDPADILSYDLPLSPTLTLRAHTAPLAPPAWGTGVGAWIAGEHLARFVASLPQSWARATAALELGCGAVAAPARALALRGGVAVATDRGEGVLALTRRNVAEDGHGRVAVAPLAWGDAAALRAALGHLPPGRRRRAPTLILAADVAYDPDAWPAFLASAAGAATAASPPAPLLLALPARPESAAFLPTAAAAGWAHRTLRSIPPPDAASVRCDIVQLWLEGGGGDPTRPPASPALVLADFDWSCVEGNTDTLAAAALGKDAEAALAAASEAGLGWTAAMSAALAVGPAEVAVQGASGVAMDAAVRAALAQAAGGGGGGGGGGGTSLVIVSDANSRFIEAALGTHGLAGAPALVVTNPARVGEGGQLTLAPFHGGGPSSDADDDGDDDDGGGLDQAAAPPPRWHRPSRSPHACPLCPPNLCKGAVVEALLATATPPPSRVLYLGDGRNDACPAARLVAGGRPGDAVLARTHYPCGRRAPLGAALRGVEAGSTGGGGGGGGARVVEWREAGEAGREMQAWLGGGGGRGV